MVSLLPRRGGTARDQRGATSTEYALLASLIAITIIAAVTLLGQEVAALFSPDLLNALLP